MNSFCIKILEIKRFEERICDTTAEPDCSATLIYVLKSKVWNHEKKLEAAFSELNIDATVIDNSDLTEIDKLQYLFASVKGPAGTPAAIPTKLGYILSEKIYAPPLQESIVNSSLNYQLSELWKLEEVSETNAKIQIPDPCEERFSKSVKRNNEGRYIINLPFEENNTLGKSKEKAVQLLHMREISQKRDDEAPNCYIPYHMAINEKSTTTKCRVVFNDSSKTKKNDTEVEAESIIIEIQNLMKSGGFIFRKWSSSHSKVLEDLDTSVLASKPMHSLSDEESKQRVLGTILFWKSKAAWDDPIPSSILENWNKFTKESKHLNSISIPRFMGIEQNYDIILHGFCDASTKAFATVVYLKSKQEYILITKILNLPSTDEWHHILAKLNPADCATRGLSPQQLMNIDYWWKGPDWVNNDLKEELSSAKILTTCTVEADSVLNSTLLVVESNPLETIISKFSNFTKPIRVIALSKRFINNCKSSSKVKGQLKSEKNRVGT
ncbi:uncharacterized protein TNCV_1595901 [Trichonephila clavipes]|nr:uncharacterized protein TNCV_1595901 [Trichonephila clavipes]